MALHKYSGEMTKNGELIAVCGEKTTTKSMAHSFFDIDCIKCLDKEVEILDDGHHHNKTSLSIVKKRRNEISKREAD